MPKLIQNALYIPSQDKFVVSAYTHDFQSYKIGDEVNFIDGGQDYFRGSLPSKEAQAMIESYVLYHDSPVAEVVNKLLWGTYGKNGDQLLKWRLIKDLDQDHRKAIASLSYIAPIIRVVANYWIKRNE